MEFANRMESLNLFLQLKTNGILEFSIENLRLREIKQFKSPYHDGYGNSKASLPESVVKYTK